MGVHLNRYVTDFAGIGDVLFVEDGRLWRCAKTLGELRGAIADAPTDLPEEYAKKDYFSTPFRRHTAAHTLHRIGEQLKS